MPPPHTGQRFTGLEEAMADLARAQVRTEANLDRLSVEMRVFKDEMRAFKDEASDWERSGEREQSEFRKSWRTRSAPAFSFSVSARVSSRS